MADPATVAAFRFGFGLPAGSDPAQEVGELAGPDSAAAKWPGVTAETGIAAVRVLREATQAYRKSDKAKGSPAEQAVNRARRAITELSRQGVRAAYARAIGGTGLRERLVRFWTDHFTVTPRARAEVIWPPTLVEDAIRPHLGGTFATMLKAVATHPAMLIYLDQGSSVGPASRKGSNKGQGLNENYARELLELHTLGVGGGYSQDDVRQLAELLTGLTYTDRAGAGFDRRRAEPGAETVLGTSYDGKDMAPINRVLDDLAVNPQTARHIAGKLAVHFVADTPDPALVEALTETWLSSGGQLTEVAATLVDHPAARAASAEKARQPFDYMVAAMRALGVTADAVYGLDRKALDRLILNPLAGMGQPWNNVPGPNGWPEEAAAWITPAGISARVEWAISAPEQLLAELPDPRGFIQTALGDRATERLTWAVSAAESQREGLGLVLASPEFNRR